MAENKVPNLDAMTTDELKEFWERYFRPKFVEAVDLVGYVQSGCLEAAMMLAKYAENKYHAEIFRYQKQFKKAETAEKVCEDIYKKLPKQLHWR